MQSVYWLFFLILLPQYEPKTMQKIGEGIAQRFASHPAPWVPKIYFDVAEIYW